MPTIRDVAKKAGVAPITVSRVINNSGYVSQATRERVEAAVADLGYIPNMLGPSLRFKRTNTLALVVTDIGNPFWTRVTRGVEDTANEAGYNVIFCNTDESEDKQDKYLTMLFRRQVDGILLVPAKSDAVAVRLIQKQDIPVVVLDRRVPYTEIDIVRSDSEKGAAQLVNHLIELGHCQIASLSGPEHVSTAMDRVNGYLRALTQAGLGEESQHIFWGQFTCDSGYEMAQKALHIHPKPTALFAGNNFIAIGAINALTDAGLRVPDDISVVAFDDLAPSMTVDPFLTVASQPAYDMGVEATKLLLAHMSGVAPDEFQEIVFPVDIIVRSSTGPVHCKAVGSLS